MSISTKKAGKDTSCDLVDPSILGRGFAFGHECVFDQTLTDVGPAFD